MYSRLLRWQAKRRFYSTPAEPTPSITRSSRLRPYINALSKISERTRTPLPSLVVSFALLHELTAIVPLVGFFFMARYAGVGERVTGMLDSETHGGWIWDTFHSYVKEGEKWAERVGRRYGFWGYEKGTKPVPGQEGTADLEKRLAGDVTNAVVAYAVVKALLPLRIGTSLYLSPAFSRRLLEPTRRAIVRVFPRSKPHSKPKDTPAQK